MLRRLSIMYSYNIGNIGIIVYSFQQDDKYAKTVLIKIRKQIAIYAV